MMANSGCFPDTGDQGPSCSADVCFSEEDELFPVQAHSDGEESVASGIYALIAFSFEAITTH